MIAGLLSGLMGPAGTAIAMPVTDSPAAPSIASHRLDYAPGELVELAGAGWPAGEAVTIVVNDDAGATWRREVVVEAGADGVIGDSFHLPDWFVAEYSVRATGASGSVATATFTDGNLKVAVVNGPAAIGETLYSGAGCAGSIKSGPKTVTIPPTDTVGLGGSESLRLDAPATAGDGRAFVAWSQPAGGGLTFAPVAGTGGRSVCVTGFQNGTRDITASYVANAAPTIAAGSNAVAVPEGSTAATTGTYADANAGDTVAITASRGTVTKTGTGSGTWSWSLATTDGPDETGPVTITADDGHGGTAATTFTLTVANVAPTARLSGPTGVDEGSTQTYDFTVADAGSDGFSVDAGFPDCDAAPTSHGSFVPGSLHVTVAGGSFQCSFPDGAATADVKIGVRDSDGASGTASQSVQVVAVANVAPEVTAAPDQTAVEGTAASFDLGSFTDPGVDSPWSVDVDWGDGSPQISYQLTATGALGTVTHTYPDGPATHTVRVTVTDADGAPAAGTFKVEVENASPTVTLAEDGERAVTEGSTHRFDYSISDPGADAVTSVAVSCGADGALVTGSATHTDTAGSFECSFPDGPASSTVSATATDDDGGEGVADTQVVAIANAAPRLTAAANHAADEGGPTTFELGSFADPGPDAPWTIDVDWGDGTPHGSQQSSTTGALEAQPHTYADGPATHTVTVTVTDADGASGASTFEVAVANVAPAITSFAGTDGLAGPLAFAPSVFSTDFTDPGRPADTHSARLDWSAGPPATQTVSPFVSGQRVQHGFPAGCGRGATVTVTDKDGDSDTATTSVDVGTGAFLPPLADQPVSDKLKNGQVLPVKIKITDCRGVPITGLKPVIALKQGDLTAISDDAAETIAIGSVSAADTGTQMRAADGHYAYNLRVDVPGADLGKDHTIVIHPYGTGTPSTLRHVIVATK